MLFKLLDQHVLMLFVYLSDKFKLLGGLICLNSLSGEDLVSISEPDRAMIILHKFTTHLEHFNFVDFLNVVAHFETLFLAVTEIFLIPDHSYVVGA
jgi:hypothetical protein